MIIATYVKFLPHFIQGCHCRPHVHHRKAKKVPVRNDICLILSPESHVLRVINSLRELGFHNIENTLVTNSDTDHDALECYAHVSYCATWLEVKPMLL